MSQHSKRKRRGPEGFEWTIDNADDRADDQPRTTRIRHTNIDLDATGVPSSNTSYITAPASPEKRADLSAHGPYDLEGVVDDETLPVLIDCPDSDDEEDIAAAGDAQVDPQYQQHLNVLDPADAPRKQKTPAVSHSIDIPDCILNFY